MCALAILFLYLFFRSEVFNLQRLREMGRGEGSVVSEMTMGTVDM